MWSAFKLVPFKIKLLIGVLFLAFIGAVAFGSMQVGLTKGRAESKVAIAQYETKLSDLRAKISEKQTVTDTKIVTKYITDVKEVEKIIYRNRDVIKTVVPEKYYLTKGWLYAYNQSVRGLPIDAVLAANDEDSGIIDSVGLETINDNNGKCIAREAQITGLQDWINETRSNHNSTSVND